MPRKSWRRRQRIAAEAAIERAELQREAALEAAAAARAHAAATRTPWFLVFLGKLLQAFLWTFADHRSCSSVCLVASEAGQSDFRDGGTGDRTQFRHGSDWDPGGLQFWPRFLTITICFCSAGAAASGNWWR